MCTYLTPSSFFYSRFPSLAVLTLFPGAQSGGRWLASWIFASSSCEWGLSHARIFRHSALSRLLSVATVFICLVCSSDPAPLLLIVCKATLFDLADMKSNSAYNLATLVCVLMYFDYNLFQGVALFSDAFFTKIKPADISVITEILVMLAYVLAATYVLYLLLCMCLRMFV